MRDCYPYLNATQYQGRQILDMARMRKFKKNREKIVEEFEKLRDRIETDTEKEDEKGDDLADLDDALDDLDAMAAIEELEGMEAI